MDSFPSGPPAAPATPRPALPQHPPRPSALDRLCIGIEALIALCLAVMVVMVFGNVVLRYAFNSGIAASEEVSRWLFVWLTFLGAIVALKEGAHLGSDMLVARLPAWGQRACLLVGIALMLFITGLIFTGSLEQVKINWDVEAPVTGAPMAVVYSAGLLFAVAAGALLLRQGWRAVTGQLSAAELVMVTESEEAAELQKLKAELDREGAASTHGAAPDGAGDGTPRAPRSPQDGPQ